MVRYFLQHQGETVAEAIEEFTDFDGGFHNLESIYKYVEKHDPEEIAGYKIIKLTLEVEREL